MVDSDFDSDSTVDIFRTRAGAESGRGEGGGCCDCLSRTWVFIFGAGLMFCGIILIAFPIKHFVSEKEFNTSEASITAIVIGIAGLCLAIIALMAILGACCKNAGMLNCVYYCIISALISVFICCLINIILGWIQFEGKSASEKTEDARNAMIVGTVIVASGLLGTLLCGGILACCVRRAAE